MIYVEDVGPEICTESDFAGLIKQEAQRYGAAQPRKHLHLHLQETALLAASRIAQTKLEITPTAAPRIVCETRAGVESTRTFTLISGEFSMATLYELRADISVDGGDAKAEKACVGANLLNANAGAPSDRTYPRGKLHSALPQIDRLDRYPPTCFDAAGVQQGYLTE